MLDFRYEGRRWVFFTITVFGFVSSQIQRCRPDVSNVYLSEDECIFMCSTKSTRSGYYLCKSDGRTVLSCTAGSVFLEASCVQLSCQALLSTECSLQRHSSLKNVYFVADETADANETLFPTYIHSETKPNSKWPNVDIPRISFEEPNSQIYVYGILSFFFGVIAFFIFALVFRFIYKRYQHQPVHVHTFSGHRQIPLSSFHLRSFLTASTPRTAFPHPDHNSRGIPGFDLPPSYVVASELLDPPPSYEVISKSKGSSAQNNVTSL